MPGSGKTTLARLVAQELKLPLFSKDRMQRVLRDHHLAEESTGDGYYLILDLADEQLSLGVSPILDATFPLDHFRTVASEIASRYQANLCAFYCECSDDKVWKQRMQRRVQYVPNWQPVGWDDVMRMRDYYQPWKDNALTVDSMQPPQQNFAAVLEAIRQAQRRQYIPYQPQDSYRQDS
jgi:predicted kinase